MLGKAGKELNVFELAISHFTTKTTKEFAEWRMLWLVCGRSVSSNIFIELVNVFNGFENCGSKATSRHTPTSPLLYTRPKHLQFGHQNYNIYRDYSTHHCVYDISYSHRHAVSRLRPLSVILNVADLDYDKYRTAKHFQNSRTGWALIQKSSLFRGFALSDPSLVDSPYDTFA